jgi:hypothetical protein
LCRWDCATSWAFVLRSSGNPKCRAIEHCLALDFMTGPFPKAFGDHVFSGLY